MTDPLGDAWEAQRTAVGAFIRSQRQLSNMSVRELSRITQISNAYISQIERGLHDPTLRVLVQIGNALQISVADMLGQRFGACPPEDAIHSPDTSRVQVDAAIRADPNLTTPEKDALLTVYRSYLNPA